MKISSSNFIPDAAIVVDEDSSIQNPDDVKTFDFAEKYFSAGTAAQLRMTITLAAASPLSYVAIAGHTLLGTTEVRIDTVLVASFIITDNRTTCQTLYFAEISGTVIELTFTKAASSNVYAISHIAAGETFDVPNKGETSGFSRSWLTPSKKQQVVLSDSAAPTSIINKSIAEKATLNLPNMPKAIAEGSYRDLCDFIIANAFFILEQEAVANSSYLCFDAKINPPKAHSDTRELVNSGFSFRAFTGN